MTLATPEAWKMYWRIPIVNHIWEKKRAAELNYKCRVLSSATGGMSVIGINDSHPLVSIDTKNFEYSLKKYKSIS